jgi:hypothetical protein
LPAARFMQQSPFILFLLGYVCAQPSIQQVLLIYQINHIVKADAFPLMNGSHAQGRRQMGFSGSGAADPYQVMGLNHLAGRPSPTVRSGLALAALPASRSEPGSDDEESLPL